MIDSNADSNAIAHIFARRFVSDVLVEGYRRETIVREFLNPVDSYGYDVILEVDQSARSVSKRRTIARHIQLKQADTLKSVNVLLLLQDVPSGCVVLTVHDKYGGNSAPEVQYFVYGAPAGKKVSLSSLPTATHLKKTVGSTVTLRAGMFLGPLTVQELYEFLFNPRRRLTPAAKPLAATRTTKRPGASRTSKPIAANTAGI